MFANDGLFVLYRRSRVYLIETFDDLDYWMVPDYHYITLKCAFVPACP